MVDGFSDQTEIHQHCEEVESGEIINQMYTGICGPPERERECIRICGDGHNASSRRGE